MKKIIIAIIIVICGITSCSDFNKEEPVAAYNDNIIYNYQISEFVKLKTRLIEIYYNNIVDIDYAAQTNDEITKKDYFNYIEFCQYSFAKKEMSKYLEFSDEEKRTDYFVSLERYNYFYNELEESDLVDQIFEYNKWKISEGIETMYCGAEIMAAIEELAIESDMPVNKYIEEVYLDVAIDLDLQDYKSDTFLNNYFKGEICEDIEGDVFLSLSTTNYSSEKLQEFWNTSENYYNFLYEYSSQFYLYLKEKTLSNVRFIE